jgi:glycosyltransferase involved in cell wall biosynthesis
VHVAVPGTDPAPVGTGTADGGRLLCVGAVTPLKGQDLLLSALAGTAGPWRCTLVGSPDRDAAFAAALERGAVATGIAGRLRWTGALAGGRLGREFRDADLLVVPSRSEAYGMVVGEALAAGVPVLAAAVGGIPDALGHTPSGVPGMLVPPEDPAALAAALESWLGDRGLRDRLRRAALRRRERLPGWEETCRRLGSVLAAVGPREGWSRPPRRSTLPGSTAGPAAGVVPSGSREDGAAHG